MDGLSDPRWVAAARWVFIFMRRQFMIGNTFLEIEREFNIALAKGELHEFVQRHDVIAAELRLKTFTTNQPETTL